MRIALIAHTNAVWTSYYGHAFQERGHVVKVGSFHEDALDGLDCEWLGTRPFVSGEHQGQYLTGTFRARRLLRRFRPDVVYAPYVFSNGVVASLAWRGPLVISAVGGDVLQQGARSDRKAWLQRQALRYACRRASRIHAVSEELAEALVACGVAREAIARFPIGVDLGLFSRPAGESSSARKDGLVCVRKHEPVYENHVVLEALSILRDEGLVLPCTFLATGSLLEAHKRLARTLSLEGQVRFAGDVPHQELARQLKETSLYVSASSSDGTSSALLEAMAAGCLPVVSRIRANEGWIEHGSNGLFFEVGAARDLAQQIKRARSDTELALRARTQNRARVEAEGNMATNMDRMEALLCEAVGSP